MVVVGTPLVSSLGSTECILLWLWWPWIAMLLFANLHYASSWTPRLCQQLAFYLLAQWFDQFLDSCNLYFAVALCGNHRLDHFICEVPALLKLACDTTINELVLFAVSILFLIPPALILISLWLHNSSSAEAQISGGKAQLSTCSSHLTVVIIFYGTTLKYVPATKQQLCSGPRQVHLTFLYHGDPHLKSYYLYFKKQGCERCSEETSQWENCASTDMKCKEVITSHVVTQFLLSQNTLLNFTQIKLLFTCFIYIRNLLFFYVNNKMYISYLLRAWTMGVK